METPAPRGPAATSGRPPAEPPRDPLKFTTIAHRDHAILNPLDPATFDEALTGVALAAGDRVIDVGCGKASLLVRVLGASGATGLGVDINPAFLAEARTLAGRHGAGDAVTLLQADAATLDLPAGSFALGICIGATHAFGGYRETLRALRRLVRPGGWLLVGQGYWKQRPSPEYLERLGATEGEMTTHQGNLDAVLAEGLVPRGSWTSSERDWDRYEDLYADSIERYVAEHPDDPDAPAFRERIRRWRETYRQWGRETLGFGLYRCGV
jgi:ubiquinone/menaquinone biosynthesis C-methylase UbiE